MSKYSAADNAKRGGVKISELEKTDPSFLLQGSETLPVAINGKTKSVTISQIMNNSEVTKKNQEQDAKISYLTSYVSYIVTNDIEQDGRITYLSYTVVGYDSKINNISYTVDGQNNKISYLTYTVGGYDGKINDLEEVNQFQNVQISYLTYSVEHIEIEHIGWEEY